MQKFFSISMPIYNAGKYLNRCLESIINQSESDYELILVDDGSTDDSLSICKTWERKYPDIIKVVSKTNSGSLFTRRRCLEESNGKYIYIMDADDYLIDKSALKKIRDILSMTSCDVVFFNCTTDGKNKFFDIPYTNGRIFENEELITLYKDLISNHWFNPLWNKVFARELVDWDSDYSEYKDVTNGTDLFQSIPIISNAKKIYYLDEILYYYQTDNNSNSIVHKFKPTIYFSNRTNFLRLVQYSNEWNIEESEKEKMLRTAFMRSLCTAVSKTKLIQESDNIDKKTYIKEILKDPLIDRYFTLYGLPFKRKILAILIKCRFYLLILCVV